MSKVRKVDLKVRDVDFEGAEREALVARLALSADEERRRQPAHPPGERLTAYYAGELSAEEAARLQDHLAVCPICTQTLLYLPIFDLEGQAPVRRGSSEALETPSAAQTAASWQAVRARLADWERRSPVPPDAPSVPPAGQKDRRRWPRFITTSPAAFLGMALGLLCCLIGFPVWLATQGDAASVVVYLGTGEVVRGPGSQQGLDIELPGRHGSLTVVCQMPAPPLATYRVEIQTLHGKESLVSAEALPQSRAASLAPSVRVKFPAERLAPGDYRLVVSSPRGEPIDEWPLHIHAPR